MYSEVLLRASQTLEQHEDILAAMLENLQIGRYQDCMQFYSLLHKSVIDLGNQFPRIEYSLSFISLGLELDNFPEDSMDPYESLSLFPSQICKKDLLENFNVVSVDSSSINSIEPSCPVCTKMNISSEKCRFELQHNEPHSRLKSSEAEEYLFVAQYLAKKFSGDDISKKRLYRRWKPFEKHSLLICLHLFQDNISLISQLLHRTEGQVKAFLQRLSKEEVANAKQGRIPSSPPGYYLPEELESYFVEDMKAIVNSQLAPQRGAFGKLLRVATSDQECSMSDGQLNIKAFVLSNPPLSLPQFKAVSNINDGSFDFSLLLLTFV